jgi:hypothetical protein
VLVVVGDEDGFVAIGTGAVTASAGSATVLDTGCSGSVADGGAGDFVFAGSAAVWSDPLGLVIGEAGASGVRPPVPSTTPGGVARTSSKSVELSVAAPEVALVVTPLSAGFSVLEGSVSSPAVTESALELVEVPDPVEPVVSSAHAGALPQPATTAAPTPSATAKPPTRPTYGSHRIR